MVICHIPIKAEKMTITGLSRSKYADGNMAVRAHIQYDDGLEEIITISVNIPEQAFLLKPRQFFLKTWSELEAISKALMENGFGVIDFRPGDIDVVHTGFVTAQICWLAPE